MRYASVVPDIPTRSLGDAYHYAIPEELADEALVGATVLVTFARRAAVGYVVAVTDETPEGLDPSKVRPIERVLATPAFDERAAQLAAWMADEYAAPLSECLRLFVAPGQSMRVRRESEDAPWQLVCEQATAVDDRWVELTPAAADFEPAKTASRQRALIEALSAGPVRMAELSAMMSGVTGVVNALVKRGVVAVSHRRRVRGGDTTTLSS
ncbi:MAG: primosomal protein N', partial [Atopobiaceae bacterium]|nr:primosomal protein N' [Atopobiaceae bacterium]